MNGRRTRGVGTLSHHPCLTCMGARSALTSQETEMVGMRESEGLSSPYPEAFPTLVPLPPNTTKGKKAEADRE